MWMILSLSLDMLTRNYKKIVYDADVFYVDDFEFKFGHAYKEL